MDYEKIIDLVINGDKFMDDILGYLPGMGHDMNGLEMLYNTLKLKEEIAYKLIEDIFCATDEFEHSNIFKSQSLAGDYSLEIADNIIHGLACFFSTDDIFSSFESEISYKKFIADEVDEVIDLVIQLYKEKLFIV